MFHLHKTAKRPPEPLAEPAEYQGTDGGNEMNKTRKIDLLYRKAKGQGFNASPEEIRELRKYKVEAGADASYATKANIRDYVTAVDGGACFGSFYDWCMNNKRADRRRRGSSEKEIASFNRSQSMGAAFLGWLTWGVAIYWIFDERISVNQCAVLGAIVSILLQRYSRKWAAFTLFLLPLILVSVIASF